MDTVTLALTARDLLDLHAAVRAYRVASRGTGDDLRAFRSTRLALLAPRLTDALDQLQHDPAHPGEAA